MLIFPQGVRLATSRDMPLSPHLPELLAKINNATIEPGYIVRKVEGKSFQNYVEANVNSPQIWSLFRSLCAMLLPDEVQLILGDIDEINFHSPYTNVSKIIELLERFQFYLANDCYFQFGLGSSSPAETCEIFVTATKHFQVWTNKVDILENIMRDYGLSQVDSLQFIDEFPRATTPLEYENGFYGYQDLLDYLIKSVS